MIVIKSIRSYKKMRVFNLSFFFALIAGVTGCASNNGNNDMPKANGQVKWKHIKSKDGAEFDLPLTMEITAGEYTTLIDGIEVAQGSYGSNLTAQPTNRKDSVNGLQKNYSSIILENVLGFPGQYEVLDFDPNLYSIEDMRQWEPMFKNKFNRDLISTGHKLIEWYPMSLLVINGMSCLHFNYTRQFQNNPEVIVHNYTFFNNDRMHSFGYSYRISETDLWANDFGKVLQSLRIRKSIN